MNETRANVKFNENCFSSSRTVTYRRTDMSRCEHTKSVCNRVSVAPGVTCTPYRSSSLYAGPQCNSASLFMGMLQTIWLFKIWGFHGGDYDDYHLLGDDTSSPTSLCLYKSLQLRSVTCSHSCTLKMEAIRSSETSVLIRATRGHLPEDDNLRVCAYTRAYNFAL
jgi:hypothetical protein